MVSTLNYPSFKEFNIRNQKPLNVLVSIILIFMVIAYKPKILLFLIMSVYVLSGPAITLYRLNHRQLWRKKIPNILSDDSMDNKEIEKLRDSETTG